MVPTRKPRGYWGIFIAAGLAATTAFAVAFGLNWLEATTPELSGNTGGEEEVTGYYPGGNACDPSAIWPFPYRINTGEAESCKEAREEHRLKANDLIQQTRSADAADVMTGLTYKRPYVSNAPRPGKPVECMRRPMLNNSSPGQAVYEPFSGSGTSLIAAETCGRLSLSMELDPAYVDVAVLRWQSFAGGVATLDGDGRSFAEVTAERSEQPA